MIHLRRILAELKKLAITFEEYKKLYPKTRKTPSDPLFTKPQKKKLKPENTPAESPTEAKSTETPSKTRKVVKDEHPAIKAFVPNFSSSHLQKPMSFDDFKKNASDLKADDIAWHLMNSEFVGSDSDDLRNIVYNQMGIADYYAFTLLNPHVSKKTKDGTASWILEKSGVTFVASKKIKDLITACAEKGIISKKVVTDNSRQEHYDIKGMNADQLKKIPKNKVQDNFTAICRNTNAPTDMLVEFLNDDEVKSGLTHISNGFFETSGYMVGIGKRKREIDKALNVLTNRNLPFEHLKFLEKSMDDFVSAENYKGAEVAQILANHPDINKPENKNLRDKVLKVYQTKLFRINDKESQEDPYRKIDRSRPQQITVNLPTTFNLTEEEFMGVLNNTSSKDSSDREYLYKHPSCPIPVLKKALASRSKDWWVLKTKGVVFDALISKNAFSDKDLVKTVQKNLNLDGDPELLKKFAKNAYVNGKQDNQTKRTLTKASDAVKKQIAEEMAKTAKHEEFDFEVVDVYELDKPHHDDFAKTSESVGNVKTNLYHGTSFDGAGGILSTGIRIGGEGRTGAMFGQGFYIAGDSSKAVQYAGDNFSQHEGEGVVFTLQAALGKSKEMKYGRPWQDDMGSRSLSEKEEKMRADYKSKTGKDLKDLWHYDHDSVSAKAGTSLMHDEYVVKDASQVQINQVVVVRKKPRVKT